MNSIGGSASVRLVGVSKRYREGESDRLVLDGLDAEFNRGEFSAVTGRSGSGKSTLLNLIAAIDLPNAGEVWVAGERVSSLDDRNRARVRRERIGFVYQSFNLIPTLSVLENLLLALELRGRLDANSETRAFELLERVGLRERASSFPDRLSGGEEQRVAIARALVHDPDVVLADEPTGNLDVESAARVIELFQTLVRGSRKTLILVTHDRELAAVADRVFDVREGKLVLVRSERAT